MSESTGDVAHKCLHVKRGGRGFRFLFYIFLSNFELNGSCVRAGRAATTWGRRSRRRRRKQTAPTRRRRWLWQCQLFQSWCCLFGRCSSCSDHFVQCLSSSPTLARQIVLNLGKRYCGKGFLKRFRHLFYIIGNLYSSELQEWQDPNQVWKFQSSKQSCQ